MTAAERAGVSGRGYLVTGAASGVGRAQAVALAGLGAKLCLLDAADIHETVAAVEAVGETPLSVQADVRDAVAVSAAVAKAAATWGQLDGLCATAGICQGYGPFWEVSQENLRVTLEVNVLGTWNTLAAAARHWLAAKQDDASIVVTGSIAGLRGLPSVGHYVVSKHGQLGLVRTAARELGPYGIRVNAVAPTNVDTPMFQRERVWQIVTGTDGPVTREEAADAARSAHHLPVPWVEPDDVAAATTWLLSDAARFVTGVVLPIDAGALDH